MAAMQAEKNRDSAENSARDDGRALPRAAAAPDQGWHRTRGNPIARVPAMSLDHVKSKPSASTKE
jgi:hypothetical protein